MANPSLSGGPKQRTVLASLLLHPNQVVPAEDLIDQVWGEGPPDTARKTLQGYVTHLRRALGPDRLSGGRRDTSCASGPVSWTLPASSRSSGSEGHNASPDRAAACIGGPWSSGEGPRCRPRNDGPLAAEAHRLEELRLEALEARIAADLDAGRHDELVPELTALTREQPLRERPWGHLMVALYRSGRQATRVRRTTGLARFSRTSSVWIRRRSSGSPRADPQERSCAGEPTHERLRGYELVEEIGKEPSASSTAPGSRSWRARWRSRRSVQLLRTTGVHP